MLRIEIIANRAISPEVVPAVKEALGDDEGGNYWSSLPPFTAVPQVNGTGLSGPCLGDDVWPEQNEIIILYGDERLKEAVARALAGLRERFPIQGLAAFAVNQAEEL